MHGLQEIRRMNDPTATDERYQAQWKGEGWCVFDSHTNGWGATYATARDCQQACDALNTGEPESGWSPGRAEGHPLY